MENQTKENPAPKKLGKIASIIASGALAAGMALGAAEPAGAQLKGSWCATQREVTPNKCRDITSARAETLFRIDIDKLQQRFKPDSHMSGARDMYLLELQSMYTEVREAMIYAIGEDGSKVWQGLKDYNEEAKKWAKRNLR